jgi:hypothetical protein
MDILRPKGLSSRRFLHNDRVVYRFPLSNLSVAQLPSDQPRTRERRRAFLPEASLQRLEADETESPASCLYLRLRHWFGWIDIRHVQFRGSGEAFERLGRCCRNCCLWHFLFARAGVFAPQCHYQSRPQTCSQKKAVNNRRTADNRKKVKGVNA